MPGIGYILALAILYEVGDISRFKTVQDFCSYARLDRLEKESDGKCLVQTRILYALTLVTEARTN
jgi:transposase